MTNAEADLSGLPCRERWPAAEIGSYDPRCCRFPKSCSVEDEPEDDPVHYYFTELRTGLTSCGINALDEDEDVSTTDDAGKATCEACRVAVDEEPVAESVSVDVLDLVRQYGSQRHMHGLDVGGALPDKQGHGAASRALFARIEAEVERLRAELDDEREYIRRLRASAVVVEVEELRAEVERLRAAPSGRIEQAHDNHGDALWIHGCGHVAAITAPHVGLLGDLIDHRDCTTGVNGPWRPLLVGEESAKPQQDGPLVLTLPQVPEGAWLRGVDSGRRWTRQASNWRCEDFAPVRVVHLGAVLVLESPNGVTVETAPPREPRTWPKLDDQSDDDLPTAVTVNGELWRRRSPDGVLFSDGTSGMTLAELRTTGDVREVFEP